MKWGVPPAVVMVIPPGALGARVESPKSARHARAGVSLVIKIFSYKFFENTEGYLWRGPYSFEISVDNFAFMEVT